MLNMNGFAACFWLRAVYWTITNPLPDWSKFDLLELPMAM